MIPVSKSKINQKFYNRVVIGEKNLHSNNINAKVAKNHKDYKNFVLKNQYFSYNKNKRKKNIMIKPNWSYLVLNIL